MTSLLNRLFQGRTKLDHLTVTVFTREQCGCCHKALDLLKGYQGRHGFTIEAIDVDSDPTLAAEHGESVPVVAIGGKIRFRGVVNPVLFERFLKAESRRR